METRGRKPKEGDEFKRSKTIILRISESDLKYLDDIVADKKSWEPTITRTDVIIKAIREFEH